MNKPRASARFPALTSRVQSATTTTTITGLRRGGKKKQKSSCAAIATTTTTAHKNKAKRCQTWSLFDVVKADNTKYNNTHGLGVSTPDVHRYGKAGHTPFALTFEREGYWLSNLP